MNSIQFKEQVEVSHTTPDGESHKDRFTAHMDYHLYSIVAIIFAVVGLFLAFLGEGLPNPTAELVNQILAVASMAAALASASLAFNLIG